MIDIKTVEYLAKLSALEFEQSEMESIQIELQNITSFVEQIQKVEVDDDLKYDNRTSISELRDDVAVKGFTQEEVLMNAPLKKKGAFAVPKMLD